MSNTIMIDSYILVKPSKSLQEWIKKLNPNLNMPARIRSLFANKIVNGQDCDEKYVPNTCLTTSKDYMFMKSVDEKLKKESDLAQIVTESDIKTFRSSCSTDYYLRIEDLLWLNKQIENARVEGQYIYLHELLRGCVIYVPENEKQERNPELEKRCIRLKTQQDNLRYKSMTKNVDNIRIRHPEDTIAYQIKQLNKQLIAVAQFVVSVLTGFAFGFIGIELCVGDLDFGFKLLLGIMAALIIALAELYFLAKQLNET